MRSGSRLFVYTYDQVGNLLTSDDSLAGLGTTVQEFDKLDRLTKKVTVAGAVYYEFDRSGKKVKLTDADLSTSYYVFDAAGRLDRLVLDDSDRVAYYHFDDSGMVTTKILPLNKVVTYYSHDDAGRLKQLQNHDDTGALISYFAYQRNPNGAATWIRRGDGRNEYYEFDARDRLTLDQLNDTSSTVYGFRYSYDQASNRVRKDDEVASQAIYYEHDARNLLTKEHRFGTTVTSYFDYDQSLRMTVERSSSEARYFSYDQRDMPTRIKHEAGSPDAQHEFSYNGLGERVRVAEGSTEAYWSYDGRKLIRERRADDSFATFRRYRHNKCPSDAMGSLIEIDKQSFVQQYPAFDQRGSTDKSVGLIDGVIRATVYYEYDAFGVRLGVGATSGSADSGQRLQFASPIFARLNTTPSIYLSKGGVYLAERGLSLVGGLHGLLLGLGGGPWLRWQHGVGPTDPAVGDGQPVEGCGEGDDDDPNDQPLPPQEARGRCPGKVLGSHFEVWPRLPLGLLGGGHVALVRDLQQHAFLILMARDDAYFECMMIAGCQFRSDPIPSPGTQHLPTLVPVVPLPPTLYVRRHLTGVYEIYAVDWLAQAHTFYPCVDGPRNPRPPIPLDLLHRVVEEVQRVHERQRQQLQAPRPPQPPQPKPPTPPPPPPGSNVDLLTVLAGAAALGLAAAGLSRGMGGGPPDNLGFPSTMPSEQPLAYSTE